MTRMIFAIEDCFSRDQLIDLIYEDIKELISFGQDLNPQEIESWFDRYDYIKETECQQS